MRLLKLFALLALITAPAFAQPLQVAVTPISSTAAEASHILKALPGKLYWLAVSNQTSTAGFVQVFNSITVPADGSVVPLLCVNIPATGTVTLSFLDTPPAQFTTGITAVISSGAVCTTKTTGVATAFFQALLQ